MSASFAGVTVDDGVRVLSADVNGFTVAELAFPPNYVQGDFEPELPYVAFVLDGALAKSFRLRTIQLDAACGVTMPAGAAHGARFGVSGARIVIVKVKAAEHPLAAHLTKLADIRGAGFDRLARRIAGELRATDAAAPLAAEGYALELLAATCRETGVERCVGRAPSWLSAAEELLRSHSGDCVRLSELAQAVGVHPAHLARVFRARLGISVGEYGRRVRVDWAAAEIARTDTPLATIAALAGFADQSHFTRVFTRYVGATPARYREEMRRA